jgi:hypothetical protein
LSSNTKSQPYRRSKVGKFGIFLGFAPQHRSENNSLKASHLAARVLNWLSSDCGDVTMDDVAHLNVQVSQECDLVVTEPATGERVIYRREGNSPILVMMDSLRADPDAARVRFLVSAWKAAHAKAQQLGWLKS